MLADASLSVYPQFYTAGQAANLFQQFIQQHVWPDNHYQYAGRQFILPRLQTWHADQGIRYSYSNNLLQTQQWTPLLSEIRQQVQQFLGLSFNAVLVNLYRDGHDYVGWHADNEAELGEQPQIASLTLGVSRYFAFKHKKTQQSQRILLNAGTLLLMQPAFQQQWLHCVPPDQTITGSRINLTFRRVLVQL